MWAVIILLYLFDCHQAASNEVLVPSKNVLWSESFGRWSKFKSFIDWHDQLIYKSKSTNFSYLYSRPVKKASNWSIAYNYKKRLLYWVDESMPKKIFIQPANQSFDWTLQENPVVIELMNKDISLKDLVVDWSTENIYATDPRRKAIVLVKSANKTKTLVFTKEIPENLCIDSQQGLLFWSEKKTIMKMDTAGSNVQNEFVADAIISSLCLFKSREKKSMLLWMDSKKGVLMVCEIGKKNCKASYTYDTNKNFYKATAVFKNHVFMTNARSLSIDVISLSSNRMIQSFEVDAMPHHIVSDLANGFYPRHDCYSMKCDHFCVNEGEGKGSCLCMNGYYLALDGVSCEASHSLFIYTTLDGINLANPNTQLPIEDPKNLEVSVTNLKDEKECSTLSYHYGEKKLFYSKTTEDSIFALDVRNMATLSDDQVEQITAQVGTLTGLAVNWKDSILLWMDGGMGSIMASRFDGRYHSIVRINLKLPQGLAVDAYKGIMFWSEIKNSKRRICEGFVKVDDLEDNSKTKCFFDLQDNDLDDIVYDPQTNRLFISNRLTNTLTSIDMSTRNSWRYVVDKHPVHQFTKFRDIMILAQGGTQPMLFVKQPSNGTHSTNGTTVSAMKGVKFVEKSPKSISWTNVNDIVLFNSYLQPREPVSPCASANPCRQHCSSFSQSHQCLCAIGYHGANCESEIRNVPALYFLDTFHKQVYQLNLEDDGLFELLDQPKTFIPPNLIDKIHSYPHPLLDAPQRFLADETTNVIYLLDGASIKSFNPASKSVDMVYENKESQLDITQMSLDEKARKLFFTSLGQGTIHVLDLNRNKLTVWTEGLMRPNAIFVSKDSKRFYWSEGKVLKVSTSLTQPSNVTSYVVSGNISALYEHVCNDAESVDCNSIFVATESKILKINITSTIENPQTTSKCRKKDVGDISVVYDSSRNNIKVSSINSLFVYQYHLYFSATHKRTVYRLNLNESRQLEIFPVQLFARISQIQLVQSKALSQESSPVITTIIIAAVVSALLLLLLLCLLCLLCCYLMRRRKPKEKVDVVASTSTSATTLPSTQSGDDVWDSSEMVHDQMVVSGIYRQNLTSNNKELSELTLNVDMFKNGSYIVDNTTGTLESKKSTKFNSSKKIPDFTNKTKPELNSLREVKTNQEPRPLPAVPSTPKTPILPPSLKPTPPTPPPPLNKNVSPSLVIKQEQKTNYNKPPQDSKQFLSIFSYPPKLHTQPRGFAPASHARPAPVKSTWGRKKFI